MKFKYFLPDFTPHLNHFHDDIIQTQNKRFYFFIRFRWMEVLSSATKSEDSHGSYIVNGTH